MCKALSAFLQRDRRSQGRILSRRMTCPNFCFKKIGLATEWRGDGVWGGTDRSRDTS